jgi:ABC-type transporter Mla subunit MlaD
MDNRINDINEQLDRKTSRSICDAVGERLQQNLRPDFSRLSPRLQRLMDELRGRDGENHRAN